MRIVKVEKCGVGICPYCQVYDTCEGQNLCSAIPGQPIVHVRVEGFPKICPLEEVDDLT